MNNTMNSYTSDLLLIRPFAFRGNEQTSVNNTFQKMSTQLTPAEINRRAVKEFDALIALLKAHNLAPLVIQDTAFPDTPDSIFPNNMVSFDAAGRVIQYPMFAENRRQERQLDIWTPLRQAGFQIQEIINLSYYEEHAQFLEGTGAMVLDRTHKIAYCSLSARVNKELFLKFCVEFSYRPFIFETSISSVKLQAPIYHTNVLLSLCRGFAVVCLSVIRDDKRRQQLQDSLTASGYTIIALTEKQLHHFSGNIVQLQSLAGEPLLLMSTQAYMAFTEEQLTVIKSHTKIIHSNLSTIESYGGGSARCMVAEIWLPKKINTES